MFTERARELGTYGVTFSLSHLVRGEYLIRSTVNLIRVVVKKKRMLRVYVWVFVVEKMSRSVQRGTQVHKRLSDE